MTRRVKIEACLQYPWAAKERFDPIYEIEELQGKNADHIQLKYILKSMNCKCQWTATTPSQRRVMDADC